MDTMNGVHVCPPSNCAKFSHWQGKEKKMFGLNKYPNLQQKEQLTSLLCHHPLIPKLKKYLKSKLVKFNEIGKCLGDF